MHYGIERNSGLLHLERKFRALRNVIDATKAFDRVDYYKLFPKLIKRNISPVAIRLLLNLYTSQVSRVRWNDVISVRLPIHNRYIKR